MACKYKKDLDDNNFCRKACYYCTYEQEKTCKRKVEEGEEGEQQPKPCPFCGEHLVKETDYTEWTHPNNDCYLAGADSEYGAVFLYPDEIEAWNRRSDNG